MKLKDNLKKLPRESPKKKIFTFLKLMILKKLPLQCSIRPFQVQIMWVFVYFSCLFLWVGPGCWYPVMVIPFFSDTTSNPGVGIGNTHSIRQTLFQPEPGIHTEQIIPNSLGQFKFHYCIKSIECVMLQLYNLFTYRVALLAWDPWVPGKSSIFEEWVPEPIDFGKKGLQFTLISSKHK